MNCVIFDVDGTLATFDADRLGHLVHGAEKHWDDFHDAMADAPVIVPVVRLLRHLKAQGEQIVNRHDLLVSSRQPCRLVSAATARTET